MSANRTDGYAQAMNTALREINMGLARGGGSHLPPLVESYLSISEDLFQSLSTLTRLFGNKNMPEPLYQALAHLSRNGWTQISLLSSMVTNATLVNQEEQALALAEEVWKSTGFNVPIGARDYLAQILPKGKAGQKLFTKMKYGSYELDENIDIFAAAKSIIPRLALNKNMLTFLRSKTQHQSMASDVWSYRVHEAFALDHVVQDLYSSRIRWNMEKYFDQVALSHVRETLRNTGGTLLITIHGGHIAALRTISDSFEDWLTVQAIPPRKANQISAAGDARAALFAAFRALESGQVVLIAPDGGLGTRAERVMVFDIASAVSESGAMIAYEAKSATAWFAVNRVDDVLTPTLIFGPKCKDDETYAEFKVRWLAFYGQQIECLLSGDPSNLTLKPRWTQLFAI